MTIYIGIARLSLRIHTYACKHRQQDDLIGPLSFFQNKESGMKTPYRFSTKFPPMFAGLTSCSKYSQLVLSNF
jgi:hypothetical protein